MFRFGNPNLYAMGIVDQYIYNRNTGDVIGYDNIASEAGASYTFDLTDLTGFQDALAMSLPHTTRFTGTYTSNAFSLSHRANLIGSEVNYNAVGKVCEEITATGATLSVTRQPARFYAQKSSDTTGWCYVHEKGATAYDGVCYHVNLTSKEITDFVATSGKTYEVQYFTQLVSAQSVGLSSNASPNVVTIVQRRAIYSAQGGDVGHGTLAGHLYVVAPLAMLEGDAGIDGNQTTNSTTVYNWRAILPSDNLPVCDMCNSEENYLGYFVYVPCGNETQAVQNLAIIGGNMTVVKGNSLEIPVVFVMPDDSIIIPDAYQRQNVTYTAVAAPTGFTVSTSGVITTTASTPTGDVDVRLDMTVGPTSGISITVTVEVISA